MSRSTIKFLPLFSRDMKRYFSLLLQDNFKKISLASRRVTINGWNNFGRVKIHQGRYVSILKINEFHSGYKFGALSKTRKPFFFRSKKKR